MLFKLMFYKNTEESFVIATPYSLSQDYHFFFLFQKKNASLLEQLKVEKNRIKNMERFRRLEIEGFQTDIKMLKGKIKELEKQLMKVKISSVLDRFPSFFILYYFWHKKSYLSFFFLICLAWFLRVREKSGKWFFFVFLSIYLNLSIVESFT